MGEDLPERTQINSYGKLLTISDVDEQDDGKYMCKASNSAGEAVHYFDVIVEGTAYNITQLKKQTDTTHGSRMHLAFFFLRRASLLGRKGVLHRNELVGCKEFCAQGEEHAIP